MILSLSQPLSLTHLLTHSCIPSTAVPPFGHIQFAVMILYLKDKERNGCDGCNAFLDKTGQRHERRD